LLGLAAALGQFENSALGLGNELAPEIGVEGAASDHSACSGSVWPAWRCSSSVG
jgi:hypothetical protein